MFSKLLVADRGTSALRIIQTCKELNIKTVAVYSTAERDALHLRYADETICIGPQPIAKSYHNIEAIITAAEITNCDAIHPGFDYLAVNLKLSLLCEQYGIKFIGQSSEILEKIRNKLHVKKILKNTGISTVPFYEQTLENEQEAHKMAEKLGYPVIIKTSITDFIKNSKVCKNEKDILQFFDNLKKNNNEVVKSGIYIEKYLENVKNINIQIISDYFGNITQLIERDCTIQFKGKTLVYETPSPMLTEDQRKRLTDTAIKIVKILNLKGLITIEFLADENKHFFFKDVFANLQRDHICTEEALRIDLVEHQIKIADGLPNIKINYSGIQHIICCDVYAENPYSNYTPSVGEISFLHFPNGRRVRIDSHLYSGTNYFPFYDNKIATITVNASTRNIAIKRLLRALNEFTIEGILVNTPLIKQILVNEDFDSGQYFDTIINKALAEVKMHDS